MPVVARKGTFSYRAGKFVKRHKVEVFAAALVLITLVVGILITFRQTHLKKVQRARAERRFSDLRKLANSLMFEFHDAIKDLPGSTPAREMLVKKALEYLDSLAKEADDDRSLQRELWVACRKVGDIQRNPYSANLGDTVGALASYRKSLALCEALVLIDPNDAEARRGLADSYVGVASQ